MITGSAMIIVTLLYMAGAALFNIPGWIVIGIAAQHYLVQGECATDFQAPVVLDPAFRLSAAGDCGSGLYDRIHGSQRYGSDMFPHAWRAVAVGMGRSRASGDDVAGDRGRRRRPSVGHLCGQLLPADYSHSRLVDRKSVV